MSAFLFQLELAGLTEEVAAVIPAHREHINKLFADGLILSYSVSMHRTMVWCVLTAADEQEAMAMVLAFPLYPCMTEVSCYPLLFHNSMPEILPGISLN